jgi:hypothetical protein
VPHMMQTFRSSEAEVSQLLISVTKKRVVKTLQAREELGRVLRDSVECGE